MSVCLSFCVPPHIENVKPRDDQIGNKKLRYREEHSASAVLSWCTL